VHKSGGHGAGGAAAGIAAEPFGPQAAAAVPRSDASRVSPALAAPRGLRHNRGGHNEAFEAGEALITAAMALFFAAPGSQDPEAQAEERWREAWAIPGGGPRRWCGIARMTRNRTAGRYAGGGSLPSLPAAGRRTEPAWGSSGGRRNGPSLGCTSFGVFGSGLIEPRRFTRPFYIWFAPSSVTAGWYRHNVRRSYIDIFGNEKREVKTLSDFNGKRGR
jgi:hypothetical protein